MTIECGGTKKIVGQFPDSAGFTSVIPIEGPCPGCPDCQPKTVKKDAYFWTDVDTVKEHGYRRSQSCIIKRISATSVDVEPRLVDVRIDFVGSSSRPLILMHSEEDYEEYFEAIKEEVNRSIICNNCGGSLIVAGQGKQSHSDEYVEIAGFIDGHVSGGYYSNFLGDCLDYRFSICEKCLVEMFSQFKIKPMVKDYNFNCYHIKWECLERIDDGDNRGHIKMLCDDECEHFKEVYSEYGDDTKEDCSKRSIKP